MYKTQIQQNSEKKFLTDLEWLISQVENHSSMDTFAAKLYLKGNEGELAKLKSLLSCFLTYVEHIKNHDVRYDSFFASLFIGNGKKSDKIPDNILMLSWNYDTQIERSLNAYSSIGFQEDSYIQEIQSHYKIFPNVSEKPKVIKLNGSSYSWLNEKKKQDGFYRSADGFNKLSLEKLLEEFYIFHWCASSRMSDIKFTPLLSFAWETEAQFNPVELAKEQSKDTEVLVVIGYSFPFFNREIDAQIIRNMNSLEKIYIQDMNASDVAQNLESIFNEEYLHVRMGLGFEKVEIVPKTYTGQFFLPPEL